MAQTNPVREPSMDEILASIRRIIESNDPIPSPGLATTAAEPAGFSGEPANDDGEEEEVHLTVDEELARREAEIETLRASSAVRRDVERYISVDAPERVTVAADETAPSRPLSLADVAARVRAASERQSVNQASRPAEPVAAAEPVEPAKPADVVETPVEPVVSSPLVTGRMMVSGRIQARPEPQAVSVEPEVAPLPEFEAPVEDASPSVDVDFAAAADVTLSELAPVVQAEEEPARALDNVAIDMPLVSAPVSDQVARSFNELAVAVELSERRSYDEIAAELLRPMLQEWLDDNLPTLVERLVREEIERVARGPRR